MSTHRAVRRKHGFLKHHSLGLVTGGILLLWIALYSGANPGTHWGSFFGNAIADWTGVFVTVVATKYFFEIGSAESRQPHGHLPTRMREMLRNHSLTIFLALTGIAWVVFYAGMDSETKWGQVIGNIVSEWTQVLALVLMTKRLIEEKSKESSR